MFSRLASDRTTQRLFVGYALIGAFIFVVDVGLFQLLVMRGIPVAVAATIAYFSAAVVHFTLNRQFNFKRFDRAVHAQGRTYIVIIVTQWIVTLGIVTALVAYGVVPLVARIAAVVLTLPFGFVANRYLTFGKGIMAAISRALKGVKAERTR